jgi:hypothetical protein
MNDCSTVPGRQQVMRCLAWVGLPLITLSVVRFLWLSVVWRAIYLSGCRGIFRSIACAECRGDSRGEPSKVVRLEDGVKNGVKRCYFWAISCRSDTAKDTRNTAFLLHLVVLGQLRALNRTQEVRGSSPLGSTPSNANA